MELMTQKINGLGVMQRQLDETWRPLRWLWDILSVGRDKNTDCGVTYKSITDWFQNNQSTARGETEENAKVNIQGQNARSNVENIIPGIPASTTLPSSRNVAIPRNKRSMLTEQLADYVSQAYSSKSSLPASLSSSPHLARKTGIPLP